MDRLLKGAHRPNYRREDMESHYPKERDMVHKWQQPSGGKD